MKKVIIFLETYHAAGSDKISKVIIENLKYEEIHLFINKNYDNRILKLEELNKNIVIHKYSLFTTSQLTILAFTIKSKVIRSIIRVFNLLLRYPLIFISIIYFYFKFKPIEPSLFIAINGGYPAAEYCRSSCVSASFFRNNKLFMIYFNKPVKSLNLFFLFEYYYDKYLDRHVQFICDSKENAAGLVIHRNINQEVKTVYNGLSIKQQKEYEKDSSKLFNMLNIAIFEDRKNQLLLIEVVKKLVEDGYVNIKLNIIGYETEAGYMEKMNQTIHIYSLKKYINILDFTDKIAQYYQNSDVFLLASKAESFPIVVLESLSYGLPVISTNVGGVSEQIKNGLNGFLIENFKIEDMAEKIKYLIDNREVGEVYGANSYEYFNNNFTENEMMRKYKLIFKDEL